MLEPTAIHSYEPPAYRTNPPSATTGGNPPSLPFGCVILESADACGGPSPALLHSLREQGCRLILAQLEQDEEGPTHQAVPESMTPETGSQYRFHPSGKTPKAYRPTSLNSEWFDAVFDKVLSITGEEGNGRSPLERFFADGGILPSQAICFACTETGARAFGATDAGLVLVPSHDKVWYWNESESELRISGADVALSQSPTARQLAWLHEVFTSKFWCVCMWLAPAPYELQNHSGVPGDSPSALQRAELSVVASSTMSALGHPPWATAWQPDSAWPSPCQALLGDEMMACPDWTPLEPRFRLKGVVRDIVAFPKVMLYCHSLDVGLAKVHHMVESEDKGGLVVRVSSYRMVSLCREGTAGTELSVTLIKCTSKNWPDICVRSSLGCKHMPLGFSLYGSPCADISADGYAVLTAAYGDANGRILIVRAWHRLCADDGRGDVELSAATEGGGGPGPRAHVQQASGSWGPVRKDAIAVDLIFSNPRRGTRYSVEKVVSIYASAGRLSPGLSSRVARGGLKELIDREPPPTLPEIEEEHCSAWRAEWDKADIELAGTRKAARFQRAVRLFRFHQVSKLDTVGVGRKPARVPPLASALFKTLCIDLCSESGGDRPSSLVKSRIVVHDPRTPPVVKIEPKVPPDCQVIRFNAALGWRWHRFTLKPGTVQILVQGPILVSSQVQLHGDTVLQPPKFIIPTSDGDDGVEVRATAWHEVQVQHALTDLGRPDGSTGGFYGLMRRTRFIKLEVLRRLFAEEADGPRPGPEGDYRDETLIQPLHNALASLQSAPRPPGWKKGDDEDLHMLEADSTTRTRMHLSYEKNELRRDILFLTGRFSKKEGQLQPPLSAGEGHAHASDLLVEILTIEEAKSRCHRLPGCRGFCFQGDMTDSKVKIHFRGNGYEAYGSGWTSFIFEPGETALVHLLDDQHEAKFRGGKLVHKWVENEVPPFHDMVWRALRALNGAAAAGCSDRVTSAPHSKAGSATASEGPRKPFRNLITDRDGTSNNYCDRYASSVQSAYNAAWLSQFALYAVDNAVFITAAPLGGRPSAEGLMELCVAPRGLITYTGSKGREYFSDATQQLLEAEELPKEQRELVEELHRRLLQLCQQPGNTKFLGIGSGLQRKFGEVTIARNDPAGTVPEPESRRFMAAVRRVKEELDPDGTCLDLHDTGTDMEIFPRVMGGRASFDKGDGVMRLDQKLNLHVSEGPNIVCGDTTSDVPMVIAALRLMCGDKMVDIWQEKLRREDDPEAYLEEEELSVDDVKLAGLSLEEEDERRRVREEAERKAREEEEEEREARAVAAKLAVLFVASPESYTKNSKAADKVTRWCEISGAHCAILPSPDVLVFALAKFAESVSGKTITAPSVPEKEIENGWTLDTA